MMYTVAITSQGQMTIPADLRRQFGLDKTPQANVYAQDAKIVVEPVPDIMSLAGVFATNKKINPGKARRAFENYLATRHLGNKLI